MGSCHLLSSYSQEVLADLLLTFCPLCHLQLDHDLKHAHELRQAAFKLYASLGSNDEDIRKKVTSAVECPLCFLCPRLHAHPSHLSCFSSDHRNGEHDGQDSQWLVRVQHQSPFGSCQVHFPFICTSRSVLSLICRIKIISIKFLL